MCLPPGAPIELIPPMDGWCVLWWIEQFGWLPGVTLAVDSMGWTLADVLTYPIFCGPWGWPAGPW